MNLLIITNRKSDLSETFSSVSCTNTYSPDVTEVPFIEKYDAVAILGGTEEKPLILNAFLRDQIERFADTGKPVFLEYVNSFRCVYSAQPTETVPHRLVCAENGIFGLEKGDLLDSGCNSYIHPHFLMPDTTPILYYKKYTAAHRKLKDISADDAFAEIALFKYDNILTAAFRMCDFRKGLFSPAKKWQGIVNYICSFLGMPHPDTLPEMGYSVKGCVSDIYEDIERATEKALTLLNNYLVTSDGKRGIREGLSHNILPDGTRKVNGNVRADCTGEAAGAFLFSFDNSLTEKAHNMYSLCYGPLTVHSGDFDGMMRWTEEAWNVCYQDDVARAIFPSLMYAYFGISDKYVESAEKALDFLCECTCKDGLLPARTDVLEYIKSGKSVKTLAETESGYASAHYNAYYSTALLLGYEVTGNEKFRETGIKGLETLMSKYPETVREHSETSEMCRLIFPLSVMYGVTKDKKHYDMLDRVYNDLQKRLHPSGGYAEWDTGYKAACFNNAGGECSLLAENGDMVADMLYTVNWLPLGFAFAYLVSGEKRFLHSWEQVCGFFVKTQITSEYKLLDGGWCRGIDLDSLEYCGIPHDVGWGPCSLETGWTVAEITMGMLVGKGIVEGKLIKKKA